MAHLSPEEAQARNIERMGEELGTQFSVLWQEVAWIHQKWSEYVELFGTKPERVELLNRAAPLFFRIVQDTVWEDVLLHLARLVDSPRSLGKSNLTLCNLPSLMDNPTCRAAVLEKLEIAAEKTHFCRDWRNRRIAHRDLALSLNQGATPLEFASRLKVKGALCAIADVLNIVDGHYQGSKSHFDLGTSPGGAMSLLYALDAGVRTEAARNERLSRGEWSEDDLPRDL